LWRRQEYRAFRESSSRNCGASTWINRQLCGPLQPTNFRHLTRYQGAVSYPGTISGGLGRLLNDNATDDPVEQEAMKAMLAFFDDLISVR
jgi:hypothetical protein